MPIRVELDVMLARRKVKSKDLAEHVGITEANLSLLKQGKVKGVRFDTLAAICDYLQCQPGDLLVHVPGLPPAGTPEPPAGTRARCGPNRVAGASAGQVGLRPAHDVARTHGAGLAGHFAPAHKQRQCGNAADVEARPQIGHGLGVHLGQPHMGLQCGGRLL